MTLCVSMKRYVLYVVKINMFMLGTFVSNGLHFDDAKSSCVVLIISRTWRSFSITPAFSRSRPINCQFKTDHRQILIILSSRPFMAPIWGLGIEDNKWRSSTYFRVQVPSFIMAPNMVGFGHCKHRAQLLSPEIRMKFFHCRFHLIGVMFHKDNPNRVNPIFYIWFARRHFYLPHKSPQCCLKQSSQQNGVLLLYWCSKWWHMDGWKFSRLLFSCCMVESPRDFALYISSTKLLR